MMVFGKMRSRCYLNNLIISFQIKRLKKLTISNITEELEIAEIAEILKGIFLNNLKLMKLKGWWVCRRR
jgi:hypothetical protein